MSLGYIVLSILFNGDSRHTEAAAGSKNHDWKMDRFSSTPKSLLLHVFSTFIKVLDNYFQHEP